MARGANSKPGAEIRRLREGRQLRPIDIQRISEVIKRRKNCADFGISHATLSDIENEHTVPSVRKMFSLAVCLALPLEQILSLYDASPGEVNSFAAATGQEISEYSENSFPVHFDSAFDARETMPLTIDAGLFRLPESLTGEPPGALRSFAWIGTADDAMADLIPGGSLIEIDRGQFKVEDSTWSKLRERPIYFCWTKDGYRCCWCEQDGPDLILVPHPESHTQAKRYRFPREASVIGRVTHAWVHFGLGESSGVLPRTFSAR